MRSGKIVGKWAALTGVLFCVMMAAGCGKGGAAKGDPNQIVYVAEYV